MADFQKAFKYSVANEGGFADVKDDAGGPTKFGITIGTLSRWRQRPISVDEVKSMTLDEAEDIYYSWYWSVNELTMLNSDAIATAIFDIGIVRHPIWAVKYAQELANRVWPEHLLVIDGHMGGKTLERINSMEEKAFVNAFATRAENGFRSIVRVHPAYQKFLDGWLNRCARLRTLTA